MPRTIILRPEDRHAIDLSGLPRLWPMSNPSGSREAREVRRQMREVNRPEIRFFWCLIFRNKLRARA